jgi:phosphinothricin acetyltransferase
LPEIKVWKDLLMSEFSIVQCNFDNHAGAILDILNEAIENSTALYDYQARSMENMVTWFEAKRAGNFPVIGLESPAGELLGFASYGTFRAWPAYKYSVEHSIYIHKDYRDAGLGKVLLAEVIEAARRQGKHALIGGIDAANQGSIALHEKFGFKHVGTLPEVGFKFGRWLDLAFYQLTLETPMEPIDG